MSKLNAVIKFLAAARNLVRQGMMTKDQVLDFAKREFGEVSELLKKQIDDIFKKPDSGTKKKGDVVPFKKKEKEGISKFLNDDLTYTAEANKIFKEGLDNLRGNETFDELLELGKKDKGGITETDQAFSFIKNLENQGKIEEANKLKKLMDEIKASDDGLTDSPFADMEKILKGEPAQLSEKEMVERALKEITKKKSLGTMSQESIMRAAIREFLERRVKDGSLTIPDKGDLDAILQVRSDVDPIDIFRKAYGEDAIKGISDIQDDFSEVLFNAQSYKELGDQFEKIFYRESDGDLLYNTKPKEKYGYDEGLMKNEELKEILEKDLKQKDELEKFDVTDRKENAGGGLNYLMGM